ncbi:MAG: hypothetical protein ABID63_18340 [Pseudomonadota bacterium]
MVEFTPRGLLWLTEFEYSVLARLPASHVEHVENFSIYVGETDSKKKHEFLQCCRKLESLGLVHLKSKTATGIGGADVFCYARTPGGDLNAFRHVPISDFDAHVNQIAAAANKFGGYILNKHSRIKRAVEKELMECNAHINACAEENERLRAALEFYADPVTWRTVGHPQIDWENKPILKDQGERAREALGMQNDQ